MTLNFIKPTTEGETYNLILRFSHTAERMAVQADFAKVQSRDKCEKTPAPVLQNNALSSNTTIHHTMPKAAGGKRRQTMRAERSKVIELRSQGSLRANRR